MIKGRRVTAVLLVAFVAGATVLLGAPATAYADPATPTLNPPPPVNDSVSPADKTGMPGFVIAGLAAVTIEQSLPSNRADAAVTYQMNSWAKDGGFVGTAAQAYQVVNQVPVVGSAFRIGQKLGGWFDSALGIDVDGGGQPAVKPDPNFVPYADAPPQLVDGWTDANLWPMCTSAGPNGESACGYLAVSRAAFVYGQQVPTGTGLTQASMTFTYPANETAGSISGSITAQIYCVGNKGHMGGSGFSIKAGSIVPSQPGNYTSAWSTTTNTICAPGSAIFAGPYAGETVVGFGELTQPQIAMSGSGWGVSGNSTASWLPAGAPGAPPPLDPHPPRVWDMRTTCVDGSAHQSLSAQFRETDSAFPGWPSPFDCSASGGIKSWELDMDDAASGGLVKKINDWIAPPAYTDLLAKHPECAGELCATTLWKIDSTGRWLDCFTANDACDGWARDPNREDTYKCTYGPAAATSPAEAGVEDVGLSGCYQYAPTFNPKARAAGKLYSDPAADPGPSGPPEVDNDPAPHEPPAPAPSPAPNGSPSCFPNGWAAFNPVEWVLHPIECAFIPDPAKLAALEAAATADLNSSGLGGWFGGIGGLFGKLGGAGNGCEGPTVVFPITGKSMQPFNACTDPMKTVAGISYAFSTVLVVVFGALAGLKAVGSAFGYHIGIGERVRADAT